MAALAPKSDLSAQEAFLRRQLHLLSQERSAEHDSQQALLRNYPPKILAQNGLAILHLHARPAAVGGHAGAPDANGAQFVELFMSHAFHPDTSLFPPHTFRPGDIAELQDESVPVQADGNSGPSNAANASSSSSAKGRRKDAKKKSKERDASPARGSSSGGAFEEKPNQQPSSSGNTKPLSGVVYRVSDNKIILTLNSKATPSHLASNPDSSQTIGAPAGKASKSRSKKSASSFSSSATSGALYRLVKVANDVTFDRMEKTLLTLARERLGLSDFEADQQSTGAKREENTAQKEGSDAVQPSKGQEDPAEDSEKPASAVPEVSVDEPPTEGNAEKGGEGVKTQDGLEEDEDEDDEVDSSSSTSDEAEPDAEDSKSPTQNATKQIDRSSTLIRALLGMEPFDQRRPTKINKQDLPPLPISPPFQSRLNDSQIQAIRRCLVPAGSAVAETGEEAQSQSAPQALPFHLIHGPPGTGKTTTIVELILQIALGVQSPDIKPSHLSRQDSMGKSADAPAMRPARTLVCGASNLAVDTIAERLLSPSSPWKPRLASAGAKITRIGHPARVLPSVSQCTLDQQRENSDAGALLDDVHADLKAAMEQLYPTADSLSVRAKAQQKRLKGSARKEAWARVRNLRKELRVRESKLTTNILAESRIVLSTLHGAGDRALAKMHFDYIIIDEACQALEAACWIAILKAREDDFGGAKLILSGDHKQLGPTIKSTTMKREGTHASQRESGAGKRVANNAKDAGPASAEAHDSEDEESETEVGFVAEDDVQDVADAPAPASAAAQAKATTSKSFLRTPRSLETTLFDRLLKMYGPSCKSLLSVQYRMNNEIMAFPNQVMYEGKLRAHESCANIRLADLDTFDNGRSANEGEEEEPWAAPVMFLDTAGADMHEKSPSEDDETVLRNIIASESKWNEHEVDLVMKHVGSLVSHGLDPANIAIIAPYSAQVAALASVIRPQYPGIEIGTVDGMQGREKDAIILTLVRSNDKAEVGFLREKRRLNVAMTRAKRHLAIIGDSETVENSKEVYLKKWVEHLQEHATLDIPNM